MILSAVLSSLGANWVVVLLLDLFADVFCSDTGAIPYSLLQRPHPPLMCQEHFPKACILVASSGYYERHAGAAVRYARANEYF